MAQTSNAAIQKGNRNETSRAADLSSDVKVKEEKIDPEIENKIQLLNQNIKIEAPDNGDEFDNNAKPNGYVKNEDPQEESDEEDEYSNGSDSSSQGQNNDDAENDEEGHDEKKNIEPVKSSNEILTELFKVFNADPPEELLDDKNLIEKAKKNRKEKKKKHKKQKSEALDLNLDDSDPLSGEKCKHKKSKKKHKHKQKGVTKEKDKDKSKDIDKEKSKTDKRNGQSDNNRERDRSKERTKSKDRSKSKDRDKKVIESLGKYDKTMKSFTDRKRHHDKNDNRADNINKRKKTENKESNLDNFYNGLKALEQSRERVEKEKIKIKTDSREKKSHTYSEEYQSSDISLSDEETYLKEKETQSEYSKRKLHNTYYDGLKRSRSRDKERDRDRNRGHSNERYRDRDRNRDRENSYRNRGFSRRYHSRYSRSRSRSRSRDLGIDKKRLLEIARKNAISMFKRGSLPGCDNMSQEIKDKVLLKMRYGGRTVEDLTEFCKKISNGENLSDLSSDEESDVDKTGTTKAFHHPFQLKEREPIVMHIRNSKPILPTLSNTEDQSKAITMQFPVSSGQQHRMTENWVPVEAKDKLTPLPALPAVSQSTTIFKSNTPKNALGKSMPLAEEQEPAFKSIPATSSETVAETTIVLPGTVDAGFLGPVESSMSTTVPIPSQPMPYVAPTVNVSNTAQAPAPAPAFVPDVPVPSTNSTVFPQAISSALDVSSIISKRLNAMRRLQENPLDSEALKMMYSSQKEMSSWASSKYMPGKFTGSTGANVLKPNELNSGPQVWARRDQLTSTKPVTGGMGMHLLQKMGWRPGEGLGREKNGSLQPLLLDIKLDKRGLVAQEDCNRKGVPIKRRVSGQVVNFPPQNLEEKHPVCLLNELTSKRKWTPPLYTLINEIGPSHSKMFLFSVQVNGQTFTPNKACNTKKEAKMVAAKHCLQQIGILPAS